MTHTVMESPSSTTSSLSRTLSKDALLLPNLSPLTERKKFLPTLGAEYIANDLQNHGFDVGWSNGVYQVSPTCSPNERSAAQSAVLDAFLRPTEQTGCRPRTSSLTFSTRARQGLDGRPRTSGSVTGSPTGFGQQHSLPKSASAGRFTRLAASLDALPSRSPVSSNESPEPSGAQPSGSQELLRAVVENGRPLVTRSLPDGLRVALHQQQEERREGAADGVLDGAGNRPGTPGTPGTPGLRPATGARAMGVNGISTSRPGTSAATGGPDSPTTAVSGFVSPQRGGRPVKRMAFKPTRGHSLLVFNEMDKDKNGKITRAEFEDAALSLGYTMQQCTLLFDKFDRSKKNFLEASDWGHRDFQKIVDSFTLMFMQKYMSFPDIAATPEQVKKYWANQALRQVKTLPAAINLVRVNAVTRGSHAASSSGNPIFDTFKFIDADNSGDLSKEEVRDAFFALGVFLSDNVVNQILTVFDQNQDGVINYYEFVKTMFPGVNRAGAMK